MISAEDAFLILDKLYSEKAVVSLIGSFFGLSFVCKGRIARLSEREFVVVSLDAQVNFSVDLAQEGLAFEYREPGSMEDVSEVPEAALRAASLMLAFPTRLTAEQFAAFDGTWLPKRETVFLMELPDGV